MVTWYRVLQKTSHAIHRRPPTYITTFISYKSHTDYLEYLLFRGFGDHRRIIAQLISNEGGPASAESRASKASEALHPASAVKSDRIPAMELGESQGVGFSDVGFRT